MTQENSLAHTKWMCKYHIVWIPKYRKKKLFGDLRRELGLVLRELARQRESEIAAGQMTSDPVHILISIPPKYSVSQVVGYIKGKSAIHIARTCMGRQRNFTGEHFWTRGYYVSTVGLDEGVVRQYIQSRKSAVGTAQPAVRCTVRRSANRFERFTSQAAGFAGDL
jgi:putative transposase